MLEKLSIKDFAIIDNLEVTFGEGLNVITGETGAGKSIIIDAINLVLGARADSSYVRKGAAKCSIAAEFLITSNKITRILEDAGIDHDQQSISVKRVINADGGSQAFINSEKASLSVLKSLSVFLIDVVSQHAVHSLFSPEYQLDILDYSGNLHDLVSQTNEIWQQYSTNLEKLNLLEAKIKEAKEKKDFLEFQLKEIKSVEPETFDLQECEARIDILKNHQKIIEKGTEITEILNVPDGIYSILSRLSKSMGALPNSLSFEAQDKISAFESFLQEVETEIDKSLNADPQEIINELDILQSRVIKYKEIVKKYSPKDGLIDLYEKISSSLAVLDGESFHVREAREVVEKVKTDYLKKAQELSKRRKETASSLKEFFCNGMASLGIKGGEFEFRIEPNNNNITPKGIDTVVIYVKTNVGEAAHPLSDIASGGEMSRVLLLVKEKYGGDLSIPTIVFDEIDAGIGGETAAKVALHLKKLSKKHQIFAITHLHQIAAAGDHHFVVEKFDDGVRTYSRLKKLSNSERVSDLARMMGSSTNEHTLNVAKNLLGNQVF